MSTNPFVEQRQRLEASNQVASVVATMPINLRATNAVPLMAILRELESSSVIEIGVIHAVTRVDVEDPTAVRTQRTILEDYRDRRLYDRDRTHCSNIKRIATQIKPAEESADGSRSLRNLDEALEWLKDADDDLLGDIARILDEAINAISQIDKSGRVDDAQTAKENFAERMQPTLDDIKSNLARMHEVAGELIDAI